jgi:CBS domain-containing protein
MKLLGEKERRRYRRVRDPVFVREDGVVDDGAKIMEEERGREREVPEKMKFVRSAIVRVTLSTTDNVFTSSFKA